MLEIHAKSLFLAARLQDLPYLSPKETRYRRRDTAPSDYVRLRAPMPPPWLIPTKKDRPRKGPAILNVKSRFTDRRPTGVHRPQQPGFRLRADGFQSLA